MVEPREIGLRDYQIEAVESLRSGFRSGVSRIVLVACTSFGKTETSMFILKAAMEKGSTVWFIVDRVNLVEQTSRRFDLYGIDHGVIQAQNERTASEKPVQIVSAQTLRNRTIGQSPDLIIWDECHAFHESVIKLIARCPKARVIGLTATPFTPGMAEQWQGVVNGTTVNKLLARDFLAPVKIKACVTPDFDGVKIKKGEYDETEAGDRGIVIIGNVVQTWIEQTRKMFGGPVKTIVFSPSVKHGAELCRQFAEAGFNFQQISYLDKDEKDRRAKFDEFRKADSAIDGLVSCAVLTKGFDQPDILCGISCRPYRKSFSSHIQELGRVMRISPETGKTHALWLDHSGNCISFAEDTAWLYEYGVESLSDAAKKDKEVREPKEKVRKERFCPECGSQMEPKCEACPDCGYERPARGEIQIVQGELIDFESRLGSGSTFKPRSGLRAACLSNPKAVWNAALLYCLANGRHGPDKARGWAFGVWKGIFPDARLPYGLYEMKPSHDAMKMDEWNLIEREVARFRKRGPNRAA